MSRESGRLTVVHITDVHASTGDLLYGVIDGSSRLDAVGEYLRATGVTPEAVVITGDLVQRGHPEAYADVSAAVARLERTVDAPVYTVLGNHDIPDAARALPGHENGHTRVTYAADLRFVLLDSSTGELGATQLAWLAEQLAEPHGSGTIVALHHPPLASPLPTLAKAGLRDAAAFVETLQGTDVRTVLCGHFHHALAAEVRGIPVSVGPSLAYHQVMNAEPGTVSGHDLAMFSLVHVTADAVVATSVSLQPTDRLFTATVSHPLTKELA